MGADGRLYFCLVPSHLTSGEYTGFENSILGAMDSMGSRAVGRGPCGAVWTLRCSTARRHLPSRLVKRTPLHSLWPQDILSKSTLPGTVALWGPTSNPSEPYTPPPSEPARPLCYQRRSRCSHSQIADIHTEQSLPKTRKARRVLQRRWRVPGSRRAGGRSSDLLARAP